MNCRADRASENWRLSGALMSGNEQKDAVAAANGLVERSIDSTPCSVESHAVKIDGSVRIESAAAETTVPGAVERSTDCGMFARFGRSRQNSTNGGLYAFSFLWVVSSVELTLVTR